MMMMTMPATVDSGPEQARISEPITLALAPSETKTVENPSTNRSGGNHRLALDARLGSRSAKCSSEVPARYTR